MVATVIASRTDIKDTETGALPNSFTISLKPYVTLFSSVENGGSLNPGNPALISPVMTKGVEPFTKKIYANTAPPISTIAFLARDKYFVTPSPRPL